MQKQVFKNLTALVRKVYIADKLREYIVSLSYATRSPDAYKFAEVQKYVRHASAHVLRWRSNVPQKHER